VTHICMTHHIAAELKCMDFRFSPVPGWSVIHLHCHETGVSVSPGVCGFRNRFRRQFRWTYGMFLFETAVNYTPGIHFSSSVCSSGDVVTAGEPSASFKI
jgi:hypothetical protein